MDIKLATTVEGLIPVGIPMEDRREALSRKIASVPPQPIQASLVGPRADVLMIGGASILVSILYWLFVDSSASATNVAVFAFYLSFIVNFPHFAASYQLLYGDYRRMILRKKSFFWAAIVAPLLIAGAITTGIVTANQDVLSFLIQSMYLTVGWHYVKQIYGVSLVTSAVQKRYFGAREKDFILLNLYSVWALSWVSANLTVSKAELDGVGYFTLGLPEYMLTIAYAATAITFLIAAVIMVRKYIRTGIRPATSSLVGFASIYFWYLPTLEHPLFFFVIPFFHSLQYMLFIFAMKKNHAESEAARASEAPQQRKIFLQKLGGFLLFGTITGALAFEFIPRGLDKIYPIGAGLAVPALWFFGFNLFINLHHYFIDNVIWRGDNEFLKTHLVGASQKRAAL